MAPYTLIPFGSVTLCTGLKVGIEGGDPISEGLGGAREGRDG